jgi:hypothetical protein
MVAGLLNKLLINQTKSRAWHCNNNVPVKCKTIAAFIPSLNGRGKRNIKKQPEGCFF